MIRYSQIEDLPEDHPLVKQFTKEQGELDAAYQRLIHGIPQAPPAEDSLEYFDHYIAGDRK